MKTFLTILTSVIVAVAVTLLIQRHEHKPDSAVPIPEGAVFDKYPVKRTVSAEELERTCPWKAPVSEACQDLYVLPKGVSCIGKPFNTCIGGEKP